MSSGHHAGNVLVGHAHQRLSDGLRGWLQASFDGVFVVADRASLIEGAQRLQPALVVVELALAQGRLDALLAELQRQAPASRTLVLSDYEDPRADAAALDAGATGVLHNATLAADLSSAVDAVLAGQRYCPPPGAR